MTLNLQTEFQRIDKRITNSGFSIAQVCRRAGVQQSSYTRWRRFANDPHGLEGTEPRVSSLNAIEAALEQMMREALE